MWCTDCHQDVPAVARSVREPLVCPRCRCELEPAVALLASDSGISLDSFDEPSDEPSKEDALAPPIGWLEQQQTRERLRAIDWKLQAPSQPELPLNVMANAMPRRSSPWAEQPPRSATQRVNTQHANRPTKQKQKLTKTSWLLSALLGAGVVSFFVGLGLLGWSVAFQLPEVWQQGMTLTIASEGLLILSLTWMATRLWRNGRLVNRQLFSVDQQLAEIEQITGTLAGSQQSSSQHYYHHFSQAVSPHMLVANLQGQVDQLAARVAG